MVVQNEIGIAQFMIVLPEQLVDLSRIDDVVVLGKGGKEKHISAYYQAGKGQVPHSTITK